ncbi:MAG: sigma-54 dependent transcriptional regulator [Desulfohalobiaceae bacterium]|nr:sigma-54 dependent transcriptional regulator [Desulfohalobiaceae bacterium]
MANILLIDDDPVFRDLVRGILTHIGYTCRAVPSIAKGKELAFRKTYDIILLDIFLPDGNGLKEIKQFKNTPPYPQVIIITAHGDPDEAAAAIEHGAWDYLEKPITLQTIKLILKRALRYREHEKGNLELNLLQSQGIIGMSPRIKASLKHVEKICQSKISVLLTGETGTGKELFARTLHQNSAQAGHDFVVVDCASLHEHLAESTLLGHSKGAYTGAQQKRTGLIKLADKGTLFLDEIGDLDLSLQKLLLRVLQEKSFLPLGGDQEQFSDFRLVAATNKDLKRMVDQSQFRKDLYYRICAFTIHLPSLRERDEDIELLAEYFMSKSCKEYGFPEKTLSIELKRLLYKYPWPGNVRELINVMDVTVKNGHFESTLLPQHLPTDIRAEVVKANIRSGKRENNPPPAQPAPTYPCSALENNDPDYLPPLKLVRDKTISDMEKTYLQLLIERSDNNVQEACNISGLSRARLYELLKKHDIAFNL